MLGEPCVRTRGGHFAVVSQTKSKEAGFARVNPFIIYLLFMVVLSVLHDIIIIDLNKAIKMKYDRVTNNMPS